MVTPANRIARANGGPSKADPSRRAPKTESLVTADVVLLALRSRFNPLRGLTPQLLSIYLDNFLLGFVAYAALVWDQIERRDDVIRNVASKRKKSLSRFKRHSFKRDDSPEAAAHAQTLDDFYDNITVVNALDENERGGFPLLVRQMMDAVGKYYAVHEIVWQPGEILTAELRFVPLWFFENRSGRLQFLKLPLGGANGEPLDEGGWMITKGDGIMEACSIAYMFKNMPLKDWVAYSDKYGTPGVLGQTNAAKGSEAGEALKAAVASFGQNWSGVVYGADGTIKEPISLITARGEGELPFPALVERMDRALASLWRGSDLSTLSADNKGASVQQDESNLLLEDDAAMINETLQLYIDRWVIWQKFGTAPLAWSRIVLPESRNVDLDLKIDELLLKAGARMGERERLEYYGRPLIAPDDPPLHNPVVIMERVQDALKNKPVAAADLPNANPDSRT
jgi:phage gp29-like protein